MIDWLDKLPDSMTGTLVAASLWLGFNYAVLAPRAMELQAAGTAVASCEAILAEREAAAHRRIARMTGMLRIPELEALMGPLQSIVKDAMPQPVDKRALCGCAVASIQAKQRFDYAVHIASFRLIAPEKVAAFQSDAFEMVMRGGCGALPRFLKEEG